jgi:lysophospholipase L1-like esterase
MPQPGRRRALLLAVALLLLGACSSDTKPAAPASPKVYVAVGASETVGVGATNPETEAWTAVFHRTTLPAATFVNVGISGATVRKALDDELPKALARTPDIVTVWLNVNDIIQRVPAETYETQLRELVHALRRGGRARVLVANTPALDALPALKGLGAFVNAVVGPYNEAIGRVVSAEGAELVDLHAAGEAAKARGDFPSLIAADGFHPSTAGHAAVAAEFSLVYKRIKAR